jgi:undecaprenyl-diphosphatase
MGFSLRDLDMRALFAIYGGPHGAWHPAMVALTVLGSGWSVAALIPVLWHDRTRRLGGTLAVAIAAQGALVWALKLAVGRVRPWIALALPAPIGAPHDGSFPSGHAAGSFCVAAFLAVVLPAVWPHSPRIARLLGGVGFVLAALIGLSRVYLAAHFPGDVIAGVLLGSVIGACAGRYHVAPWRSSPASR